MNAITSKHPFPTISRDADLHMPVVLAPSIYIIVSYMVYWGAGSAVMLSPALLFAIGLGTLIYVARTVFRWRSQPLYRQVWIFCGMVLLVYGQMLIPRFWGWPSL